MDSEFPDPDEEFDLIHENEYEVLKEIEELEKSNVKIENLEKKQKEKNKLNTSISNVYKELNIPTSNKYNEVAIASTSKTIECNDNFDIDITKKKKL